MLKPVATGLLRGVGNDFDCIGVLQLARKSCLATVDPRTTRVQSDFRMHRERKVDRRCAFRELDDITGRREDEDFILIQIGLRPRNSSGFPSSELENLRNPEVRGRLVRSFSIFLEPP